MTSAVKVLGDDALRTIARDWSRRAGEFPHRFADTRERTGATSLLVSGYCANTAIRGQAGEGHANGRWRGRIAVKNWEGWGRVICSCGYSIVRPVPWRTCATPAAAGIATWSVVASPDSVSQEAPWPINQIPPRALFCWAYDRHHPSADSSDETSHEQSCRFNDGHGSMIDAVRRG